MISHSQRTLKSSQVQLIALVTKMRVGKLFRLLILQCNPLLYLLENHNLVSYLLLIPTSHSVLTLNTKKLTSSVRIFSCNINLNQADN
jgi:hypothetical protein